MPLTDHRIDYIHCGSMLVLSIASQYIIKISFNVISALAWFCLNYSMNLSDFSTSNRHNYSLNNLQVKFC
jgi:hypothetical protein